MIREISPWARYLIRAVRGDVDELARFFPRFRFTDRGETFPLFFCVRQKRSASSSSSKCEFHLFLWNISLWLRHFRRFCFSIFQFLMEMKFGKAFCFHLVKSLIVILFVAFCSSFEVFAITFELLWVDCNLNTLGGDVVDSFDPCNTLQFINENIRCNFGYFC